MKAQRGDLIAKDRLIKSNVRFVINIAKQYQNQGMDLQDLISEGNIGLIKSIDKFDPARGNRFITYAGWWIRQAILQALNEHSKAVKLPLNRTSMLRKVFKEQSHLQQKNQRDMTELEVLESMDLDPSEMIHQTNFSYNEPVHDGSNGLDIIEDTNTESPDSALLQESIKQEIELILVHLTKREQEIIRMYFGIGFERTHTLEEISDKFKLTRERIRQIKKAALKKLRRMYRHKKFNNFL